MRIHHKSNDASSETVAAFRGRAKREEKKAKRGVRRGSQKEKGKEVCGGKGVRFSIT